MRDDFSEDMKRKMAARTRNTCSSLDLPRVYERPGVLTPVAGSPQPGSRAIASSFAAGTGRLSIFITGGPAGQCRPRS